MNAHGKKVLIVEDDFILAKVTELHLKKLGYTISGMVSSGEQAVALAKSEKPHVILMDIQLSGSIDGIEAVETIRTWSDVPVIYVTGNSDQGTKQRALITRCSAYLVKPVDKRELQSAIESAFQAHAN